MGGNAPRAAAARWSTIPRTLLVAFVARRRLLVPKPRFVLTHDPAVAAPVISHLVGDREDIFHRPTRRSYPLQSLDVPMLHAAQQTLAFSGPTRQLLDQPVKDRSIKTLFARARARGIDLIRKLLCHGHQRIE